MAFTAAQVSQLAQQADPSLPKGVADQLGATMLKESSGDPQSVSSAGALGLLQIEPGTAQAAGVASDRTHLFDPAYNVYAALKVLCLQGSVAWGGSGTWVGPTYPPKKYGCNANVPGQVPNPSGGAAGQAGPYVFTRGTAENPDEDSWAAGCRLAQEVAWFLFPDGPRVYYSQGADLIAQKPVAVLDREKNGDVITRVDATYDNTSLQFRATKKSKSTKAPRRSTVVKPNSSTQIKVDIVCAPLDFRGGEVVQLQGYGMLDGPWIVSDATRDIFQTYTEMTLTPPTAANLEPAAGAGSNQPAPQPAAGVIPLVAQAFQRLQQLASQNIPYIIRGRNPATGLDCDGLVQQLAEAAGMDMKNGSGGGGALDVAELGKWGQAGPGQQLTLYFSNQHTFFEFNAPQPIGHIMADTMSGPGVHGGGGAAYVDWDTAVQRRWNVDHGPYTLRHWPNT